MKRWIPFVLSGVLVIVGCENLRGWSYRPEPPTTAGPLVDRTVVVLPFEDRRPGENVNALYMQYVPLFPYGWLDYGTPEAMPEHLATGRGLWSFRPVDDISRAVAAEMAGSGIFKEVFQSDRESEGDLALHGEILSTGYKGKLYTYGLSVYGPVLWILGLPGMEVSNTLEIRLTLTPHGSESPVWSYLVRETVAQKSYLYRNHPDFHYDELLKKGMKEALRDLSATMTRSPAIRPSLP